jgi:large subunit ribosomal protein L10
MAVRQAVSEAPRSKPSDQAASNANPTKVAAVAELTDQFRSSSATVLTEYRGLSVAQLKQLRRQLGSGTAYTVTKNTLAKRAAAEAGIDGLEQLFTGPTALAFVAGDGDPVAAAKSLRNFGRTNPALVIKGGVFEGRAISADEVRRLADLESREVLLAKLAGAMKANLSKAAALFQAPLSKTARLAAALQDKRQAEQAATGQPGADQPGADQPTEPAATEPAASESTE